MFEVDFKILNQKATPAIYADTLATRPAAGFVGRLFVATDSPYGVFRDTGTAWVQVASNGGGGGTSTGINGLNGTTNIGLGGTLSGNTTIAGANFNLLFTGNNILQQTCKVFNLSCTDLSSNTSQINAGNGNYLILSQQNSVGVNSNITIEPNKILSKFSGVNYGFSLDDTTGKFQFGDYNNDRKYNCFVVDDDTDRFYFRTSYNQIDFFQDLFYASNNPGANQRFVKLGDFNNYTNGVSFVVDDRITEIYSTYLNNKEGIDLNFLLQEFTFGNGDAVVKCDNTLKKVTITSKGIILNGTITAGSSGGSSGLHLQVEINGNPYVINLNNP